MLTTNILNYNKVQPVYILYGVHLVRCEGLTLYPGPSLWIAHLMRRKDLTLYPGPSLCMAHT